MRESVVLDALRTSSPSTAPVQPAPRRVLRAGSVVTVDAQSHVDEQLRVRAQEQRDLEQLLQAARAQGRAEGVADTLADGSAAVLRAAAALDQLSARVGAQQQEQVQAASETVLGLGLQVAEWVLRRELSEDGGQALLTRLELGLTALLPSPTTRISVSHADRALVAEWAEGRGRVGTEVVADHRLEPGDAVVVTDAGRAEITVAAALRTAAETLGLPAGTRP
jgi:flagellar biosynthesis/type III secretory pathway protein FliH